MKRILALLLAIMLISLTACAGGEHTKATKYTVGVCQLVKHDALDAATQGFQDALIEILGDEVSFDIKNAQGNPDTCVSIANGFVAKNVDLILSNATPALQATAAATDTIPILGTSITEYGVALGIENFNGTVGNNISGTSDLAPLEEQAAMLIEIFPDAKKVALLYCSTEANSQYQVDVVKKTLEANGVQAGYYGFSDAHDFSTIIKSAVAEADVIYIPTDNTVAANTEIINNICLPAGIPVIAGEEGTCAGCGVATLSINYYDLGVATGKMAAKVLKGEADISTMPIEYAPNYTKKYNKNICDKLGIEIPFGYEEIK